MKKLLLIPTTILASVAFAGCDLKEWSESGTYPLDLRNEYKLYNPETKKMEWVKRQWRMDIPRAYVLDTRGRNGVPARNSENKFKNKQKFSMSVEIDPETMVISPNPYKRQSGHMSRRIDIHLRNSRSVDELLKAGGSEHKSLTYPEMSELTGSPEPAAGRCGPGKALCTLFMFVDGWPIRMSVSRDFYFEPQPYCRAVREFLDDRTLHRDDQSATYDSIVQDYELKQRAQAE